MHRHSEHYDLYLLFVVHMLLVCVMHASLFNSPAKVKRLILLGRQRCSCQSHRP